MNIYKVNHLTDGNTINKIHVFFGDHTSNLTELFENDPKNSLFADIFNQEELNAILNPVKKIPVIFSQQSIHIDDTIGVIKSKIMHEFQNTFALEEIYLFCMKEETLSAYTIYQNLTQNKRIKLNRIRLDNFLLNIVRDDKGAPVKFDIPDKEVYTYDDILALNLNGNTFMMNKVLGQKFFIVENEYPFICNPFQVVEYDAMIERNIRKTMTTLNSHLLLNTGKIVANNIYLCTANDVLKYKNDPLTIQLYYPFLYDKKIDTLESLQEHSAELIEKGKKMYTEAQFKGVDLFYNVYKLRTSELGYKKRGIKSIKFVIHPEYKVRIPIDIIFKIMHATQMAPFIKYNTGGARQDKMLRMYADKIALNGRKIPYLPKAMIFKLIKLVGRNKSVSIYINDINGTCEFEENGDITFYSEFEQIVDEVEIEQLLRDKLNPVLEIIKSYFEQNGYSMSLFDTLKHKNIEIKHLQYQSVVRINHAFDIKKLRGCVSNIFIIESDDITKGLVMRFKRIANFNKMSSMEAFVIEQQKDGLRDVEIIEALLENYKDLSEKDAVMLLGKMASELQIERGAKKGIAEIKVSPGFKVLVSFNQISSDITINVENINDIAYLDTIPIYLDTLVRLTQDETSTHVPIKEIQDICSGKEVADIVYNDIIPTHEMSYIDQEEAGEGLVLADEDIIFDVEEEEAKVGNALSLFFNDVDEEGSDEEEEEEDGLRGGSNSEENEEELDEMEDQSILSAAQPAPAVAPTPIPTPSAGPSPAQAPSIIKNVDGMKLNNPYHFQTRIIERDPVLILTEKQGKYNSYSRTCPQNIRRQPVILTEAELNKIRRDHPGYLNENSDIIKYGSQPDKEFYYICPRYWDLRTDSIITPEQIEREGLQDKIIPMDAKSVPRGKYIYEFNNPKDYKDNHKQYPGFLTDSHPSGLCLPCCFAKWNVPSLIGRKQKCAGKEPAKPNANDMDEYIKGPGKFPLAINRWGYLSPAIQQLLREKNTTCKTGNMCLLRHGVEISKTQSFIACISDALYYTRQDFVSINEMKETIILTLNIDNFITYQNGNLVTDFYDPKKIPNTENPEYTSSVLYSKLSEDEMPFFIKVCNAFENFIAYLNNGDVVIDYTYLWDIISTPNPALFKEGVNLVIFEVANNDITDNVNLICPTNHYNSVVYDPVKPTLILFHQDEYFEPIYTYKTEKNPKNKEDVLYVGKLFREQDIRLSEQIKYLFNYVIKPYYKNMCAPFASMPKVYKAKHAMILQDMVNILNENNYAIRSQVVNYQGKVIGIIAESSQPTITSGFVPCYPSALLPGIDYVFMMEPSIWKPYYETIAFLKNVYKNTYGKVPCNPIFKIIEDEVVVGVLTETNQFVQLSVPIPVSEIKDDTLREIRDNNYVVNKDATPLISSDSIITMSNKIDQERENYVKKIKLETSLYQLFRTTIRMLLNDYSNLELREEIEEITKSPFAIYSEKLKRTTELLRRLVEDMVIFVKDYDYKLINELTTCAMNKTADKCNANAPLCAFTINGKCQLIIPKENLLTKSDNEKNYFLKMADELIRYNRIKSFMFEKQTYLSFGKVDYNLYDDEFIILQSLITQEYFEELVPTKQNRFIKYNSYDEVKPIISQTYVDQVKLPKNK